MFRSLKDLFDAVLAPAAGGGAGSGAGATADRVHLATAVLLVEVMRAEGGSSATELQAAGTALKRQFGLADDAIALLLSQAEHSQRAATDFHAFTSALNDRLFEVEKLAVVEAMWQVAYADGTLAAHENHVLWRVADLLHVPHGAYINAKMRAKAAGGTAS
jgi:uncharacterized tellurite resistance protein B-like protein